MKCFFEKKMFAICCIFLLALMALQPIAALECPGKQRWPELVGTKGKTAAATIEKENPHVKAVLCPPPTILAACLNADLRCDLVRVSVNTIGVVTRTPVVG